jgi:outer membrane protein assembly factor BamB
MIVFRDDTVPEVESLRSRFGAWSLIFVAATIAPAWLWWRSDRRSLSLTLACLGTAGFGMLLSLAAVVDALARHSPYLTYQIGVLRPALQPGPWAAALVCGVAFGQGAAAGWTSRRTIRPMRKSAGASAIVLRIAAVALGGLFFVRTNYAPEVTQMVRAIVALDRETGGQMWLTEGLTGPPDTGDGRNSPATPTPVVAGDRVCGYFGNAGLMCVDLQGKPAWSNTEVGYSGYYGVGFSPMVSDGKLIVASNTPGGTAIVRALDVRDGRLMWNREWRAAPVLSGNNRTPLAMTIAGGPALVVWGSSYLRILSSRTGASLWTAEWDSSGDQVASVAADEHRLYLTDAMGTTALDPALLSGAQDPVRWRSPARANCSSPVACRGLLFTVTDGGVATAVRADTGKAVWRHRMPGQYFASLIASSDAVYFTNSDGLTTVVSCETAFRRLAVNDVGEPTTASMAAADGDLYLRTASHVYRIGRR